MTQKNSKKTATKNRTAVAKKTKAKKATPKQKQAIESRIKKELAQPAQQPKPEVVGFIEKGDLKQLLSYRDILQESGKTTSMLKTAYNALLTSLRTQYDLPDECIIDEETGVVRVEP